ncbi:hypothetical protein ACHAWO_006565 [Cyclotella atomus]|uniref:BTB domain-containing protein n=1 Tax=Cyclotella atomus TaxID=382360 RepID=A0ABD3NH42_9STRA
MAPWFHELQMENYLRTCDDVLYYDERKYSHWHDTDEDIIQQEKMRLLDLLLISVNFNLKRAEETAEKKICDLLKPFLQGFNDPDIVSGHDIRQDSIRCLNFEDDWEFNFPQGNYDRKYTLAEDKNEINMEWKHQGRPETESLQNANGDRIQTCEPDLIVTVGTGNDTEISKCHKVILALASPTLNSLVEGASGELRFTNMKPKSWKSFYGCIDPNNGDKAPALAWDSLIIWEQLQN